MGASVQGVSVQGSLCLGSLSRFRGLCPGGLCQGDPQYGYVQAVCILLNAFLFPLIFQCCSTSFSL